MMTEDRALTETRRGTPVLRSLNSEDRELLPYGGDIDLYEPSNQESPKRMGEYERGRL